ncbi:hypothetical protein X975_04260, partial [Stegodyphus mimosarum]
MENFKNEIANTYATYEENNKNTHTPSLLLLIFIDFIHLAITRE